MPGTQAAQRATQPATQIGQQPGSSAINTNPHPCDDDVDDDDDLEFDGFLSDIIDHRGCPQ